MSTWKQHQVLRDTSLINLLHQSEYILYHLSTSCVLATPFFIIVHLGIINVLVSKLLHSSSSRYGERHCMHTALRNCTGKLNIACLTDGSINLETVRGIYTLVWSHLKYLADVCLSHSLRFQGYTSTLVRSHLKHLADLRLSHILHGDS